MAGSWFYLDHAIEQGSLTDDQLRSLVGQGVIAPWTPVRRAVDGGRSPWRRAGEVKGLFSGEVSTQLGGEICTQCGQLRLPDGRCGKCVPAASPARAEAPPTKAAASLANWQLQLGNGGSPWNGAQVERALRIAGVTMILAVAIIELGRWGLTDKSRFRGDNAYGATANAVEAMRFSLNLWFWLFTGVACLVFAKLSEVARYLRTIAGDEKSNR